MMFRTCLLASQVEIVNVYSLIRLVMEKLKIKQKCEKNWEPFLMGMVQLLQVCRTTTRRQFTFNH